MGRPRDGRDKVSILPFMKNKKGAGRGEKREGGLRLRAKPSDQLHARKRVRHYSRPWPQLQRAIQKEAMRIWLTEKTTADYYKVPNYE